MRGPDGEFIVCDLIRSRHTLGPVLKRSCRPEIFTGETFVTGEGPISSMVFLRGFQVVLKSEATYFPAQLKSGCARCAKV